MSRKKRSINELTNILFECIAFVSFVGAEQAADACDDTKEAHGGQHVDVRVVDEAGR